MTPPERGKARDWVLLSSFEGVSRQRTPSGGIGHTQADFLKGVTGSFFTVVWQVSIDSPLAEERHETSHGRLSSNDSADAKVESGVYNNANEVVREGLRLLMSGPSSCVPSGWPGRRPWDLFERAVKSTFALRLLEGVKLRRPVSWVRSRHSPL